MDSRDNRATVSCTKRVKGVPTILRSCDACYATKSRCTSSALCAPCSRCAKLALDCTKDRPFRTPGPKPPKSQCLVQSDSVQSAKSNSQSPSNPDLGEASPPNTVLPLTLSASSGPLSPALKVLSCAEVRLFEFAFSALFVEAYMPFKHGQDELRQVLMDSFLTAPILMKDALLACAGAIALSGNHNLVDAGFNKNFHRASKTLVHIRELSATNYQSLSILINLAAALITFSNHTIGESPQSFLWYVLSCVTEVENQCSLQPILYQNRNTGCVLFLHHFECLIRSEVPAYQVRAAVDLPEDRYFGISFSILPLMFTLCQIAHCIKVTGDGDATIVVELERIIDRLISWKPLPLTRVLGTRIERLLSAQARCLQYAAIILACKYSLRLSGRYMMLQQSLSLQIQEEVGQMYDKLDHNTGNLYITFPYFISCLDTRNSQKSDDVLVRLNSYSNHTAPATCRKMYDFLRFTWEWQISHKPEPWTKIYGAGPALSVAI